MRRFPLKNRYLACLSLPAASSTTFRFRMFAGSKSSFYSLSKRVSREFGNRLPRRKRSTIRSRVKLKKRRRRLRNVSLRRSRNQFKCCSRHLLRLTKESQMATLIAKGFFERQNGNASRFSAPYSLGEKHPADYPRDEVRRGGSSPPRAGSSACGASLCK